MDCNGPPCCAFLSLSRVNFMPFSEKNTECKSMATSYETRRSDAKASNTAAFFVNNERVVDGSLPNFDI